VEIRDLNYFLTVASLGHIGRAADSLGLTQPAITKSIARLEKELNARVLERTAKGVSVTAFGDHVLRQAIRLRAAMEDARREFADLATGEAGHLRIGTGLAMAQHLLPIACSKLLVETPGITLDITAGTGKSLVPFLRDGHLDLVLSGIAPGNEPGLRHETIVEDRVVVIARRSHVLHRRRKVTLAELAQQRWILSRSGSLLADWLEQRWREAGFPPPVPSVQVDSMATLLSIVAATDLVTFHSWSTIRHSPLRTALRPVAGSSLVWRRTLGVTYRDGGYMPLAARRLIDLLVEIGAKERAANRFS
jgi:DNA-binding transcriptional LysR family regulator